MSVLAGGAFETQSMAGGVVLPVAFADVHVRPTKWLTVHGALTQQFQLGWLYQDVKDTRNLEFGGRIMLNQHIIDKTKTFTAGNKSWNYDFLFPVKVLWNVGLSGSYRYGTAVFNSGLDPNTSIRFLNTETNQVEFVERAAVPYTFSEVSAGFVVSTATSMKLTAHLPTSGMSKDRRMKTYTEFRVEAIYGTSMKMDSTIDRKAYSDAPGYQHYRVMVDRSENWGLKLQGIFRRKWVGFKVEAGVRPGVYYRFSSNERNSILDRTYMQIGFGFGWM